MYAVGETACTFSAVRRRIAGCFSAAVLVRVNNPVFSADNDRLVINNSRSKTYFCRPKSPKTNSSSLADYEELARCARWSWMSDRTSLFVYEFRVLCFLKVSIFIRLFTVLNYSCQWSFP